MRLEEILARMVQNVDELISIRVRHVHPWLIKGFLFRGSMFTPALQAVAGLICVHLRSLAANGFSSGRDLLMPYLSHAVAGKVRTKKFTARMNADERRWNISIIRVHPRPSVANKGFSFRGSMFTPAFLQAVDGLICVHRRSSAANKGFLVGAGR